jgi:hydroxyacylglutathione hydrolase
VILDVRKKVEYDQKHIKGAINAVHVRLPELSDNVPSDRKLLVHCQSGKRASYAVSYLESRGYDVVYINDTFNNAPSSF